MSWPCSGGNAIPHVDVNYMWNPWAFGPAAYQFSNGILFSHCCGSDERISPKYMTNEPKNYCYIPVNLAQTTKKRKMPSNTDPETKLVIPSPELPKLNKVPNLKVSLRFEYLCVVAKVIQLSASAWIRSLFIAHFVMIWLEGKCPNEIKSRKIFMRSFKSILKWNIAAATLFMA